MDDPRKTTRPELIPTGPVAAAGYVFIYLAIAAILFARAMGWV